MSKKAVIQFIKKHTLEICIVSVCILLIIFTQCNSFLYKTTIAKINDVKVTKVSESTDIFSVSGKTYTQEIKATILNGKLKGQKVTIKNNYLKSQAINPAYKKGNKVFVSTTSINNIKITGQKMDSSLATAFFVMVVILLIIGRKRGNKALLSLVLNMFITFTAIYLYSKGGNLIALTAVSILLFLAITLFLSNGRNTKSYIAIASTLCGVILSCLLTLVVILFTDSKGVFFEQMDLVVSHVKEIFYIQIIIGNLGGIMDISIDMISSISEIIDTHPDISDASLKKSAQVIGSDVMGTMTSTILFAYIAGSFPIILLLIGNGYSFLYIYKNNLNIEVVRALTGCIGMVITIPISTFISIKVLNRKEKKA